MFYTDVYPVKNWEAREANHVNKIDSSSPHITLLGEIIEPPFENRTVSGTDNDGNTVSTFYVVMTLDSIKLKNNSIYFHLDWNDCPRP